MKQKKICFYTSFNYAYLAQASIWAKSVRRAYKEKVAIVGLLIESKVGCDLTYFNDFDEIVFAEELGIPNFIPWIFGLNIVEAATAIKPFCLMRLLNDYPIVTYMDPDTFLYSQLDEITDARKSWSILLTPHQTIAQSEDWVIQSTELASLKFGVYNLGFIAVRSSNEGKSIAKWWADRCYHYCVEDIQNGLFTDQKIFDLAPALFPNVEVLRHPGYNVATWNIYERKLNFDTKLGPLVNCESLRFCHFTKATHAGAAAMDKMLHRESLFEELFYSYIAALRGKNLELLSLDKKWSYGFYQDNSTIAANTRRSFRALDNARFSNINPFKSEQQTNAFIEENNQN